MQGFWGRFIFLSCVGSLAYAGWQGHAVQNGVGIVAVIDSTGHGATLVEGDGITVRIRLADSAGRTPLGGVHPAAWLALRTPDYTPAACGDLVKQLLEGSILRRAEIDLNDYYVLALNDDASIHVVDPLFGYGNSKLLAMIKLQSPGADWALTPDQNRLFVSMPAVNRVAVVDTVDWKTIGTLDTGANPRHVAIQPDGEYVWISTADGVDVFSCRTLARAARFPENRAAAGIAFDTDSRHAFLADESVLVANAGNLRKLREVPAGSGPSSVDYSSLSRFAYVSNRVDGTITVIDAGRDRPVAVMHAEPGLSEVRIAPGGRLGFVLNPERNLLHIFDTSANRILQTAEIPGTPDQVSFSDKLAYIVQRQSESVLMIPLDAVGTTGKLVPSMDFPGGQRPFGAGSLPDRIVQAGGESAVLAANPADGAIYYYSEGMAAPMGHFSNYSRQPRAVLVVDRSLKERRTGESEATARITRPGSYILAFFLDSPRVIQCFDDIDVQPRQPPESALPRITLEPVGTPQPVHAGETVRLKFRVSDPGTKLPKPGIRDLLISTYLASGTHSFRAWATPESDGTYGIDFTPEEPGVYVYAAACDSLGLNSGTSPVGSFEVTKKEDL